MRNSKHEIRNAKQIPSTKLQCSKYFDLGFGKLGFRDCLGSRNSNLGFIKGV